MKANVKRISIVSDRTSWKNIFIRDLLSWLRKHHYRVHWVHRIQDIPRGEVLFILGFTHIIPANVLSRHTHNLVVHESALPRGRGWSPATWQILEGSNNIPLTLFEALPQVDRGPIYMQEKTNLKGDELIDDIRQKIATKMMNMCVQFVSHYPSILKKARPQKGTSTYYPRRTAIHGELDVNKTLQQQFNHFRISDNEAYPAFFSLRGSTYILRIEKQS